jgi:hypothetical protein
LFPHLFSFPLVFGLFNCWSRMTQSIPIFALAVPKRKVTLVTGGYSRRALFSAEGQTSVPFSKCQFPARWQNSAIPLTIHVSPGSSVPLWNAPGAPVCAFFR